MAKKKRYLSEIHCIRLVFVFVVTVTRYLTEIILLLTYLPDRSIRIIIIIIIIVIIIIIN